MRYQGKITAWKDDQGYGFITPNIGGDKVFVHIKSFVSRRQRPALEQIVTYELSRDERGPQRSTSSPAGNLPEIAGRPARAPCRQSWPSAS